MQKRQIALGDRVEDLVNKRSDIAVAKIEHLGGRVQWAVEPGGVLGDGTPQEPFWSDDERLVRRGVAVRFNEAGALEEAD